MHDLLQNQGGLITCPPVNAVTVCHKPLWCGLPFQAGAESPECPAHDAVCTELCMFVFPPRKWYGTPIGGVPYHPPNVGVMCPPLLRSTPYKGVPFHRLQGGCRTPPLLVDSRTPSPTAGFCTPCRGTKRPHKFRCTHPHGQGTLETRVQGSGNFDIWWKLLIDILVGYFFQRYFETSLGSRMSRKESSPYFILVNCTPCTRH